MAKKYELTRDDGSTYIEEFPDNLSEEEIMKRVNAPEKTMEIDKTAEGVRKFAQGLTFGFGDELEAKIRQAGSRAADLFGPNNEGATTSADYYKTVRDSLRAKGDEFSRQNPKTALALELAGGLALPGGVVGTGAKAGKMLAPKTLSGALASGAGQGAAYGVGTSTTETSGMSLPTKVRALGGEALSSGATGLAGTGIMRGVAGALAPKLSAETQALSNKGIQMTPGQAYGGIVNTVEEAIMPFYSGIRNRRNEGVYQFNERVIDDILKPIGKKITKSKENDIQDVITAANKSLSDVYDDILPNLKLSGYPGLKNKFATAADDIGLEKEFRNKYNAKVSDIINRVKKDANKDPGRVLKNIQSELGDESFSLTQGAVGAEQTYGKALAKLREKFDDELVSQNPKFAPDLQKANNAYRRLKPVNIAGKQLPVDAAEGLAISPARLKSAAVRADKSADPGQALLQKEAKEARGLGNIVPDSGTNTRGVVTGLAATGAAGGSAAGFVNPMVAVGIATPYLAYSKAGMAAFNKFISERPRTMQEIGDFIRKNATGLGGRSAGIASEGLL